MGGAPPPAASDWKASLPDDIKGHPSLQSIKDIGSLAKSYIHGQSMIGAEKIPAPNEKWTAEQWAEHYDRLGRPKDFKEYGPPKDLQTSFKPDGKVMEDFQKTFHELGLTKPQAEKLLGKYFSFMDQTSKEFNTRLGTDRTTTESALKAEWGEDYQKQMTLVAGAMTKFGSPELIQFLNESGLGNNPHLIRAFAKAGMAIREDSLESGDQAAVGAAAAMAELERLKGDKDWMEAFNNPKHPGNLAAVKRFKDLHQQAYPKAA